MKWRGAAATWALAAALAACGGPRGGPTGASIALVAHGTRVAVCDPDQGSVSLLDPDTLLPLGSVDVGGEPHALVELGDGSLLVANYRGGEVLRIDPIAGTVLARRAVCAGPYGVAAAPDHLFALVACEWEGVVLRLDERTLAPTLLAAGLSRPRAVAVVDDAVYAAELTHGDVVRIDARGRTSNASLVPAEAGYRPALTQMSAHVATALSPAFGRLFVAHELVNHDGNTSAEQVAADYGSVLDGNPKINPAVTALSPGLAHAGGAVTYARFDGGPRVFNAPSALAPFGDRYLLVAQRSTGNVAILDTTASEPAARAVGSFTVGAGPAGVAVDARRRVAFVDNALESTVSRLDLSRPFDASAPRYAADLQRTRPLAPRYSAAALSGRRLFHDATDPHLTPSGVVACATCHPDGTDDGLTWFVHTPTIALKRRRARHLANAHSQTAPFHWDGQFATMSALVGATVTDLMAGDLVLVDTASVQAYVDEIIQPPVPPAQDPAQVARGQSLFSSLGCVTCHPPPDYTDRKPHAVLTPMSLSADDVITQTDTPGLRALFLRAPYFHDGRARTLRDTLTLPDVTGMGGLAALDERARGDLLAFLLSL